LAIPFQCWAEKMFVAIAQPGSRKVFAQAWQEPLIWLPMASKRLVVATVIGFLILTPANAQTPAPLATDPTLSPDGKLLAFALAGDIWTVRTDGGVAQRLTTHPATDFKPIFSPDATRLAFVSQRDGSAQVWVQNIKPAGLATGTPRQVTHHTSGYNLEAWYPDGKHLLVSMSRDHYWFSRENTRFAKVAINERKSHQLLFDDFGSAPSLSPDGRSVLFQREGASWWRKGYVGTQAGQIWRFDSSNGQFTEILKERYGNHTPLWKPDGKGFYVASQRSGTLNLWEHDFGAAEPKQLTHHDDDSVLMPTLSADGSTIVYRHLFDFYRLSLTDNDSKSVRINVRVAGDPIVEPTIRRSIDTADRAVFSSDGHELAVVAGGDIWMMDTELREPINVTESAAEESEPVFVDDGKALLFLRDHEGAVNIWRAEPDAKSDYWWQQVSFRLTQLTEMHGTVSNLQLNPSGCQIAYVRNRQGLYVADIDGKNSRLLVSGFDSPVYEFSPDGRWIAFAQMDNYFNSDIWIVPVDGSAAPVNISRHPKNDFSPKWSPDGRILAFTGVRDAETTDLHYVYLTRQDADATDRDRTLEKARKKIDDARKQKIASPSSMDLKLDAQAAVDQSAGDETRESDDGNKQNPVEAPDQIVIDFEDIHKRVQRVRIANASIDGLFWFGEEQTLALSATINGREGTYSIAFPEELKPDFLTSDRGHFATRLKNPKTIGWVTSGTPATLGIDAHERYRAGFNAAWRLMRDNWYDDRLGNRDWDAIRHKYCDAAATSPDDATFASIVHMMLGELNGSHLGYQSRTSDTPVTAPSWTPQTAHLGVRFEPAYRGPGLRIRDVIMDGPADRQSSRLFPGDTILAIDGTEIDPDFDLTQILNGPLDRDLHLSVQSAAKAEETKADRTVLLRPISYSSAHSLLYPMWEESNRRTVERLSEGRLGYLHIAAMDVPSLYEFERKLFDVGYNKTGLVIDVRGNGGGRIADRLLTALTQPRHAITVPRGGGPGYPQDRMVYATWNKPIIVLCNQNSFSNAEIFSHSIRVLKRGRLVGVQTGGGVVTTGSTTVMDLGTLQQPYRGWFSIESGEDMELNGAVPHVEIWPRPGDLSQGVDRVLERAVKMLSRDVDRHLQQPSPNLIKATERRRLPADDGSEKP
jgi:tricorn protease